VLRARIEKVVRDFCQAKHHWGKRLRRLPDQMQRFQTSNLTQIKKSELHGAKKVVSSSLYGNDPRYFSHLKTMLDSYRALFPDYTHRFYVAADLDQGVLRLLRSHGAEIVTMNATGVSHRYMFWRFLACEDTTLERVLVRDVDHIALHQEKTMVDLWEKSGKKFHIIRSHYSHNMRVMGGLWGATPQKEIITRNFRKLWRFQNWLWGADQIFLERYIYPSMRKSVFICELHQRFQDEEVLLWAVDSVEFSFVGEPVFPRASRDASRAEFRRQHVSHQSGEPLSQSNSRPKRLRLFR